MIERGKKYNINLNIDGYIFIFMYDTVTIKNKILSRIFFFLFDIDIVPFSFQISSSDQCHWNIEGRSRFRSIATRSGIHRTARSRRWNLNVARYTIDAPLPFIDL